MASGRGVVVGLLIGVLVVAALALLLSSARGEGARHFVRSRAQPAVGRIRDMAARLAKREEGAPEEDEPG
jgi:gas vesicle protein